MAVCSLYRCTSLLICKNPWIQLTTIRTRKRSAYWEVMAYGKSERMKKHFTLFGLQVHSGCEVMERDIIVIQRRLEYHPGLNVGIDPRDLSLFSVSDGTLLVTTEKFKPNKDHELVQKYYADLKGNMFKKYVHVIPKNTEFNFKLVDVV